MGTRTVGGSLQTPFADDAAISSVDQGGQGVGTRGGRSMGSGPGGAALVSSPYHDAVLSNVDTGETPNTMSGLSRRVDGASLGSGDPGAGGQVALPDLSSDNTGRTLP